MIRSRTIHLLTILALSCRLATAAPPTDNPVSTFYNGPEGYPAWTDTIAWKRVIDMSEYSKGKTNFEKFENARDELAKKGGGVLYYPAGTYDFSAGPFDGPAGRGLMLKSGVVIRGEAPEGRPLAVRDGKLELGTKFVFGFQKKLDHDIPRDWNLIGLVPDPKSGIAGVKNIGVAWVHITGGVVYFGPALKWGKTWASAKSWKSAYAKKAWKDREPDGTHPGDPFMGAPSANNGGGYVPGATGRLVMGCAIEKACVLNDYHTCGRREVPEGYGEEGFHMAKFGSRIAAFGSRILVANNCLMKTEKGNFLYEQTTCRTGPGPEGNDFVIKERRKQEIMWDYNRVMGIDVNKDLLGMVRHTFLKTREHGYFEEGVVIRDNWVYNHGNKGYNLAGKWITIENNRNERDFLRGWSSMYGLPDTWRLTIDGFLESSGGGGGPVSDNLSRAFDLAGWHLWAHRNVFNNTGSFPGNDGEGLLCQHHGGTHVASWAMTYNRKEPGGEPSNGKGFIGVYRASSRGFLVGWNETEGWAGIYGPHGFETVDSAVICNKSPLPKPSPQYLEDYGLTNAVIIFSDGRPMAPEITEVAKYSGDAIVIKWQDKSGQPPSAEAMEAWNKRRPPKKKPGKKTRPQHRRREAQEVTEIGFRVDRKIGDSEWHPIAYRPPQIQCHEWNPPEWIDFTAPRGKPLTYRVVALTGDDSPIRAASKPSGPITLPAAE